MKKMTDYRSYAQRCELYECLEGERRDGRGRTQVQVEEELRRLWLLHCCPPARRYLDGPHLLRRFVQRRANKIVRQASQHYLQRRLRDARHELSSGGRATVHLREGVQRERDDLKQRAVTEGKYWATCAQIVLTRTH